MRAHRRHVPIVALMLLGARLACAQGAAPIPAGDGAPRWMRLGEGRAFLAPAAPGDTLRLPHHPILRESLRLTRGGVLLRADEHYRLDALTGTIVWIAPPAEPPRMVLATYRYLPLALRSTWGEAGTAELPETLAVARSAEAPARSLPPGARLDIGGSKTVSLEFGNRRDARIAQSLDLTLRGQLAEHVQVRAVLTDRSTPLQPEGTTTELADLDHVLVEVTAPWGELTLGDVAVAQEGLRFLAHRREMEGLRLRAGGDAGRHASAALGRGVGRQVTLEFRGTDGKQGPYRLLGVSGDADGLDRMPGEDAVIVAGSERLWLDGARLTRGEDADYTIDYAAGELWFMPRRSVTGVSEIRAAFQVREGAFDRGYYALGAAAGDSLRGILLGWVRERDDPGSSAGVGLTAAERESLRAAGDADFAVGGGARPDSLGGYALVEVDTLAFPIYLYVVDDAEAYAQRYAVAFIDAGEGRGDYAARTSGAGEGYYEFVGRRRGRYVPGRRLSLPESRDVFSMRAGGELGAGVRLWGEGAFSHHDANVLSTRDDADNDGAAGSIEGRWQGGRLWGGRADRLELRIAGRAVGERFAPIEPLDPSFQYRRWNASSDTVFTGRDRRGSAELIVRPLVGVVLESGWEGLRAPGRFDGKAWRLSASRSGPLHASIEYWRAKTEEQGTPGRAERRGIMLGREGGLAADATYQAEQLLRGGRGCESGTEYAAVTLRSRARQVTEGLALGFTGQVRRDHAWVDGIRQGADERRLYEADAAYDQGATSAQLTYTRREVRPRDGATSRTDLGDWSLAHRVPEGWLTGDWRGRMTVAENRLRAERLRLAGENAGHYDSLGHYVGVGDYELYYEPGDSAALEARFESAARLTLRPLARAGARARALAGLESTLFGRIEAAAPQGLGVLLAHPRDLIEGSSTQRAHERLLRADVAWNGPPRAPTPLLRVEDQRRRERGAVGLLRERSRREELLEVRIPFRSGLNGRVELAAQRERDGVETVSATASYDERRTRRLAAETTWALREALALRLRAEGGREHLEPAGGAWTRRALTLGVTVQPVATGRIELTVERRWSDDAAPAASPFSIERPGWEVTCNGSLRPRGVVSGSLWIRVNRDEGSAAVVSGRMEMRAYF